MSFLRSTFPVAVSTVLLTLGVTGCSFSMQAGTKKPNNATNAGTPTTTEPATTEPAKPATAKPRLVLAPSKATGLSKGSQAVLVRRKKAGSGTTPPPATSTDPRFVTAATPFGGPDGNDTSFVGLIYFTNPGATALPAFDSMQPTGAMFVNTLNVAPNTTFAGFPGVDNRANDFAIRYEAPLVVGTEGDYNLRLVSDDGAKVYIDDMLILDNEGVKAAAEEKSGPVHLVAATHTIRVDYFHTTGPVGLQLFVKPPTTAETLLGTKL